MKLYIDPISLTALILLAILLGFITYDHVKPEPKCKEKEVVCQIKVEEEKP